MTLESRDTLCDANPPIFRRRPNYRPFRCLEERIEPIKRETHRR